MAQPVSSGVGRNGPWLQNEWLRVETRLDDGSISPVSLAGAFRPVERAHAGVTVDERALTMPGRAHYDIQPHADAHGAGRLLTLSSRDPRSGLAFRREIVLYDDHPYAIVRLALTNHGAALRVDAVHPFVAAGDGRARVRLASQPADWRIYRHGWQSWSPTMSLGGSQVDLASRPPELAPFAPQTDAGRFASDDVAVLYDPRSRRAILAGAASAREFLTQVHVDTPRRAVDVRCDAGVTLDAGASLTSEAILIDVCGMPNEQLERYGDALAREMGARVPAATLSGWCSWYYFFTQVTEEDVLRNLRFLERHRDELPVDTVQIDDGYQADVGDWLTVNEKFPQGMKWLASEIRSAGFTPGIWLAPFLIAESSKTYASHPEWVVHDDGAPVVASANWQRRNYALDGSHPGARAWLTDLFGEVCDGWGYDYVKIDFLYAGAMAGARHDPATTRVRAYRDALAAVRRGVGERRFILGCGSLMAPSVGVFDGNRIGPDVAPFWRFLTTEERASPRPRFRRPDDALSAETAIRNTLTRSWMHNRLWANDPDCVLVRTDRTKLTLEETRSLVTAIGLSGGMALSSDDLERVSADRLALLSMLLPPLPRPATPVDLMERDMPERFEVAHDDCGSPCRLVALFNFDDAARDLDVELPAGRWHVFELWSERYLGIREGPLTASLVEPHGCRLLALRRDVGRPQLVATNAHIGCGVLDISSETYDPELSRLTLGVEARGRAARSIFVAGEMADASATLDGEAVACDRNDGLWRIDLARPGRLAVSFGGANN
jgi:alpha-galactosidase